MSCNVVGCGIVVTEYLEGAIEEITGCIGMGAVGGEIPIQSRGWVSVSRGG